MQEIRVIKTLSSLVVLLCSYHKKDKSFESYMLYNEVVFHSNAVKYEMDIILE